MPTTAEVADAVGVSGETIRRWRRHGLLPEPTMSYRGRRGNVAVWPAETTPAAQWVFRLLEEGRTIAELQAAVTSGQCPHWRPHSEEQGR